MVEGVYFLSVSLWQLLPRPRFLQRAVHVMHRPEGWEVGTEGVHVD